MVAFVALAMVATAYGGQGMSVNAQKQVLASSMNDAAPPNTIEGQPVAGIVANLEAAIMVTPAAKQALASTDPMAVATPMASIPTIEVANFWNMSLAPPSATRAMVQARSVKTVYAGNVRSEGNIGRSADVPPQNFTTRGASVSRIICPDYAANPANLIVSVNPWNYSSCDVSEGWYAAPQRLVCPMIAGRSFLTVNTTSLTPTTAGLGGTIAAIPANRLNLPSNNSQNVNGAPIVINALT